MMKRKHNLSLFCFIFLISILTIKASAQVTFGNLEEPTKGSLLQLKNIDNITNGNANASKGLLLPRVELTNIRKLYPMFEIGYDESKYNQIHTGLVVYNINETLYDGDGEGIYTWDGEKWISLGKPNTLRISPTELNLSEIKSSASASIILSKPNLTYTIEESGNTASSIVEKNGNDLTFKANGTNYGNKSYRFKLDNSSKFDETKVNHIHLTINKDLYKVGENDLAIESAGAIIAEGGDASWYVKSFDREAFNWLIEPFNNNGKLKFQLGTAKAEGNNYGKIVVAHINDPDYTKEITIMQNKDIIQLPEFDYMVIQYKYDILNKPSNITRVDLDTATEITGTNIQTIDNYPLGWSLNRIIKTTDNKLIAEWAGDNVQSGYEAVYYNVSILRDEVLEPNNSPRMFNFETYGTWFYPNASSMEDKNITSVVFTLYKGGTMRNVNTYDYENVGGSKVFQMARDKKVTTTKGVGTFRTSYTKLFILELDRVDLTGIIMDFPTSRNLSLDENFNENKNNWIEPNIKQEVGESEDSFTLRYKNEFKRLNKMK